jgi:hypothetical protein
MKNKNAVPEDMPNDWCHSERCMRSLKHPIKLVDVGTSLPRRHLHKCWRIWNVQWEQNVGPNAHPRQRHGYFDLSSNPICKMGALSVIIFRVTATATSPVTSIIPWISLADTQQRQWPHILLTLSHYNLELTFVGGNLRFDRTGFLPGFCKPKTCR